ncbi:BMC domain-containing protein [Cetobacterium sp.]|uniref:BMC domain-containing protein n=1 Tax=Cetobacterium sp. TaxID=2071632 RepID=UPI0025C33C8D|nr:BMC domain-containing protein [Cetobacterium sp.]
MKINLVLLEFRKISLGLKIVNEFTKNYDIEIILSKIICPGKYLVLFSGELSIIEEIEKNLKSLKTFDEKYKSTEIIVVTSIERKLLEKINIKLLKNEEIECLGIVETLNAIKAIEVSDYIENESNVEIILIKIGLGMNSKGLVLFKGKASDVKELLEKLKKIKENNFIDCEEINLPTQNFLKSFNL